MLEDHSSRWSAAASPGGLIGLVLTILSLMALLTSLFALVGTFDLALDPVILYAVLGISAFTTFLFSYLLFGYIRMGYRIDPEQVTIRWGFWSETIPFTEIETAEPVTNVLGDEAHGWQPFWPGYYVATRDIDHGKLRVVSTLPPRRQILIRCSNGKMYAISPERPQLFMEELSRWLISPSAQASTVSLPQSEADDARVSAPSLAPESSTLEQVAVPEAHADRSEQSPESSAHPPVPTASEPVFGAVVAADPPVSQPKQSRPEPEYVGPKIPDEPDPDTARYPVVSVQPTGMPQFGVHDAFQPFDEAGWTREQPAVSSNEPQPASERQGQAVARPPFAPPKPVVLPAGTPRRDVIQPLVRIERQAPTATSPAIRPTIHQDPVSLAFIGIGLLTSAAMALYVWLQFDDIPPSLTLHWNVDGMPGRVGQPEEIWILPFIAVLVLLANVGLAWSIAQFDRFAARLMLSSTIVVHIITWIALLMILN
jgi:hypothetical protein